MAAACEAGCPWGEWVISFRMPRPYGYSVILCARNCNCSYGPRLVSEHDYPPSLDEINIRMASPHVGARRFRCHDVQRHVEFRTTTGSLATKSQDPSSPHRKTRRSILLVAVRKELGIVDLAQINQEHRAVRILGADGQHGEHPEVLRYLYGRHQRMGREDGGGSTNSGDFDIVAGFLASLGDAASLRSGLP